MQPGQSWRELLRRHEYVARRLALLIAIAGLLTLLGLFTDPVYMPGLCKIYP